MYCFEIPQFPVHFIKKRLGLILILLTGALFITACQKDPVQDMTPEPENEQQEDPKEDPTPGDTTTTTDPDIISEYLIMTSASKITGSLPQAVDGQLKINVQDTTYAVKGYPIGAPRILINKPTTLEIASFNVQVGGASYYYNVPAEKPPGEIPMEADSLRVLVLDVQPPDDIALPLILDIKIQALDSSGEAADEFTKTITVEDPANPRCSPLVPEACPGMHPFDCGGFPNWAWDHSVQEYDGYVFIPGFFRYSATWILQGCCTDQGASVLAANEPRCNKDVKNWEFKELFVAGTGYSRDADWLYLYDSGNYYRRHLSLLSNVDAGATDFCGELLPYIHTVYDGFSGGTHNIGDGSSSLILTRDNNASFDNNLTMPHTGGDLTYTCHKLIIVQDDGEGFKITHVYNRSVGIAYRLNQPKFWD